MIACGSCFQSTGIYILAMDFHTGMMGSGKYRVGKSLAESLGYYFFDR